VIGAQRSVAFGLTDVGSDRSGTLARVGVSNPYQRRKGALMADETAPQPPSDDLLDDLDILNPIGGLGDGDGDADADGDGDSDQVVYDDVDQNEFFAIDADTGDKEVIDASQIPDSAQIEVVDDHQDDSLDDGSGLDFDDGSGLDDDMSVTPAVDLSPSEDFEFEED
jgi:hypothetical protein